MSKRGRPIGVTILAILQGIAGVLIILAGLYMLVVGLILGGADFEDPLSGVFGQAFSGIFIVAAVIILVIGAIIFALAKGLWNLSKTVWWIETILYGLSTLAYLLNYESILANLSEATTPIITILIFIYLIIVRDAFH